VIQYEIRMTGFGRAMRALEQSDQIAFKEITQAMKKVAQDVKKGVQQRVPEVPVGNWGQWTDARSGRDLGFDAGQVRSSVRLRMNRFRQRGTKESMGLAYEVSMGSGSGAAGAIWALMGKGDRVTTTQGAALVQSINSRYPIERWNGSGQQGPRGMVAAYYAGKPAGFDEEIARKIERALDREMN
jgi:hypothetical protein